MVYSIDYSIDCSMVCSIGYPALGGVEADELHQQQLARSAPMRSAVTMYTLHTSFGTQSSRIASALWLLH